MSAARQRAGDKELPLGAQDGLEMRLLRTRMCCSRVMEGPQRHIVQVDRGAAQRRRSGAERWGRVAAACIAHRCCTCHAAVFVRSSLPQGRKFAAPTNGVSRHQVVRGWRPRAGPPSFPVLTSPRRTNGASPCGSGAPRFRFPTSPPSSCTAAPRMHQGTFTIRRAAAGVA